MYFSTFVCRLPWSLGSSTFWNHLGLNRPEQGFLCLQYKRVKFTLVQAQRLCTGRTAHRGSRGVAVPFLDHGTRRGEGSASRPGRSLTPGKEPVSIVQEAGWTPWPVWKGAENLAPLPGFDPRTISNGPVHYSHIILNASTLAMSVAGTVSYEIQPIYIFLEDL